VLVEFASAVNAVQCAVDLQEAFAAANREQPEDRHIVLRIGINIGDVMVEGSDLYGGGVNIAARLQAMVEPGGILVSGAAHDYVGNKVKVGFEELGAQSLKNIAQPIRTYRVTGTPPVVAAASRPIVDKPSIAVLPFTNMSGDPEQEYFSDGIVEDIITELSRFRALLVIARNSSFQYKGRSIDLRRVARELNVNYIVEGSIRRAGGNIRITAQLIDGISGNHLWAERYERSIQEIFAIQDDIVAAIATRVAGQVAAAGMDKVRRKGTVNLDSYDYFLRAVDYFNRSNGSEMDPVRDLLQKAIDADPGFAQAHAWLAEVLRYLYWSEAYLPQHTEANLERSLEASRRAVALDGNDASGHWALAMALLYRRAYDLARHHLDIARTLNPNDTGGMACRAIFEIFSGRPEAALELLDQVGRLDPHLPNWYFEPRGIALYQMHRYADAAAAFEKMVPAPTYVDRFLAACYAQLGRLHDARTKADETLKREPGFTLQRFAIVEPYSTRGDLDHMIEGLRKAGLPE
jgi:TolB-like protein/Tfp pilus assembly protein PilF